VRRVDGHLIDFAKTPGHREGTCRAIVQHRDQIADRRGGVFRNPRARRRVFEAAPEPGGHFLDRPRPEQIRPPVDVEVLGKAIQTRQDDLVADERRSNVRAHRTLEP
jgi:hypothetical protein